MNVQFSVNREEIMLRVLFLNRLKRFWHSPWSKLFILSGLAVSSFSVVSVPQVVLNWWHAGDWAYAFYAIRQTELAVQLLLFGLLFFGLWLIKDTLKRALYRLPFVL